ncbi:conserved repeat domain [Moraxella lacunata]|uniref:Conserved repeat domain n=1 Tax=Moraxella lacunata TaxID=477 RepID=A0A378QHM1_MORLA|nr:DUF11 domain-containing protein [Moraxella lacunata]STZ00345.1 conserved repeat domain [Moraxella lacunata]
MKSVNQRKLVAAVAVALGVTSGVSYASTTSNGATRAQGISITNKATAEYSVGGTQQPTVTSNAVVVNINEVASFSLVATQGTSANDDKNESQTAVPGGTTTFTNTLTNNGNVSDTYTINITTGDSSDIKTANQDYSFTDPTAINYTIKNANGSTAKTDTINSGGSITLQPGQKVELSYDLKTPESQEGGKNGVGTITATSQYITSNNTATEAGKTPVATLVNENQAVVKVPVFSIVKTASADIIDLNTTKEFSYTIKVTNSKTDHSLDAVNILVSDVLPAGLTVKNPTALTATTSNGSRVGTVAVTKEGAQDKQDKLTISGADLKVGETLTLEFTVTITDKNALAADKSATNHADVYDNPTDNANSNPPNPTDANIIHDSTDTSKLTKPKTSNDGDDPNEPGGDKPAVVSFTNRNITLDGTGSKEVPPTTNDNTRATYQHVIKNNGNAEEAGLTFTITNPNTGDNITPNTTVTYTPKDGSPVTLTPTGGVYTLPTLPAGGEGTISYHVETNKAALEASETSVITVTPTGNNAPKPVSNNDTTTVKGLELTKEQLLDTDCSIATSAYASQAYTKNNLTNAVPGQCIIYKITAKNGFSEGGHDLTNVVIKDVASQWSAKATYVENSIHQSVTGTPTPPGSEASSSPLTIAPQGAVSLYFKIKIKTEQ